MLKTFSIDSDNLVVATARLERIGKRELPNAARATLNRTAMHVKQVSMPNEAKEEFVQRKPSFWKAASKVEFARGAGIEQMRSTVGFVPPPNDTGRAVEDMDQQEHGGKIGGRTFIPLKAARTSKNWHKNVKRELRMKALNEMFDSRNSNLKGKNDKENFTLSGIYAGKGGLVLGDRKNARGNKTVFLIRKILRKKGNTVVVSDPVYSMRKNRKVQVEGTHFMRDASLKAAEKMESIFLEEAAKRIK